MIEWKPGLFDTITLSPKILDLLSEYLPKDTGVTPLAGIRVVTSEFIPENKIVLIQGGKVVGVIDLEPTLDNC